MFHSSFFSVKITKVSFETERGTLEGSLYMPKGAGAQNPRPVIITTHGYLNSKEMQDAPSVEMSRRGYIVLALDMYDHGGSVWKQPIKPGDEFGTFWIYSLFDAAQYISSQPYTMKDSEGNAYTAVSGHSMGGFSSVIAVYMDEMASLKTGTRSIYAAIPVGSDFSFSSFVAPQNVLQASMGNRTIGLIGAHYDEFFFAKSDAEKTEAEQKIKGTVFYKDFVSTLSGKAFLGKTAEQTPEAGIFYTVPSGELTVDGNVLRASQSGNHIIYTPKETHPWNHFSKKTTAALIHFYTYVFQDIVPAGQTKAFIPETNQIWMWKEFFNFIALIGFFLLILPAAELFLKLPVLKEAITPGAASVTEQGGNSGALYWILFAFGVIFPAVIFPPVMSALKPGLNVIFIAAAAACALSLILALTLWRKNGLTLSLFLPAFSALLLAVLAKAGPAVFHTSHYFAEPTNNQIIFWADACALISLLILSFVYFQKERTRQVAFSSYGVGAPLKSVLASLAAAVLTIFSVYLLLYIVQAVFGTDFRIWTFAVKTFTPRHFTAMLRYWPFFFIYYFVNAVVVNANTRSKKNGSLIAVSLNIGGLLLWIALQYGLLFVRGVALLPAQSLNGILLFALIPCLAAAALFGRKLYDKTNNVWLAAFLNTTLFTMIGTANTILFWNLQ